MQFFVKFWGFIKSPGTMATLTIVAFAFGIYGTLFYEKRPALAFEIISNASVYDVRENLSNLEIFYAGQNLRAENKTLRLVSLRIVNSGQTDISKGDYDESDPLGFSVQNGRVLEIPKFVGSNDYLNRHISPTLIDANTVTIAPVIFDAGEYIEVQALILTSEGVAPRISPLGKITGIKRIEVLEPYQAKSQHGLWSRIWEADSIWIQIARAPVYAFLAIVLMMIFAILIVVIAMPVESIATFRKKRLRETKLRECAQGRPLTVADQFVLEEYRNNGERGLGRLHQFIERNTERNHFVSSVEGQLDEETLKKILRTSWPIRQNILARLESQNFIKHEGIKIFIEPDLDRALKELAELLEMSLQDIGKEAPERIYYEIALAHEESNNAQATVPLRIG